MQSLKSADPAFHPNDTLISATLEPHRVIRGNSWKMSLA
jgi:hypothetical protein